MRTSEKWIIGFIIWIMAQVIIAGALSAAAFNDNLVGKGPCTLTKTQRHNNGFMAYVAGGLLPITEQLAEHSTVCHIK